jgi:hypothetical protein
MKSTRYRVAASTGVNVIMYTARNADGQWRQGNVKLRYSLASITHSECPQYATSDYTWELTNLGHSDCPLSQCSFRTHYITEIQTRGVQII